MSTPVVLFVSLLLFMIIGVPVAWSLSLSCIAALLTMDGMPLVLLTQRVFTGANNFSFLAVPAFIIAGEVMSQGGISKRLVDMTSVLLGRVRGSLGIISVVASTIFAALSGSATATTAAIGGLMYPEMERRGYPKDFSAAVQAIGGTLGPVDPAQPDDDLLRRRHRRADHKAADERRCPRHPRLYPSVPNGVHHCQEARYACGG